MYRVFNKDEIIKHTTIYKCEKPNKLSDITRAKEFFDNPTLKTLMNILIDEKINKEVKAAVLASLNTSLNYTSVKEVLNNRSNLLYLLGNIEIKPIYTYEQVRAITEYTVNKSIKSNVFSGLQIEDVRKRLIELGCNFELSLNGFNDYSWDELATSAKADGLIHLPNEDIIVYLRYGTSSGGSQNDRYRGMFDTVRANQNRKFIYVCDGPEAFLQYQLAKDNLENKACPNGIWITAKLLQFVDFEDFKILTT